MSAEPTPRLPTLDELPYLDEYLNTLLRPRVERAVQAIDRSLTESIWRQVLKTIAAEQPGWNETHAAGLRSLVEARLGLRLSAKLEWGFGKPEASGNREESVRLEASRPEPSRLEPRPEPRPEPARAEATIETRPGFGRPARPVR
ncbi:MAG: hypothetical protein ACKVW3_00445 [Phycisphaerales bacterium]